MFFNLRKYIACSGVAQQPQTKKKTARKVSNNMYTNQIIFFELFIWRALIYYKINVF